MTDRITAAQYRQRVADEMTEATLQTRVERLARELGWIAYHTHDSRRSQPGFPDLVLVRRGRIVWRELKTSRGKTSAAQREWLDALARANANVGIWRPIDLLNETILRELTQETTEP